MQCYVCERCGNVAKIVHHKKYLTKENINDPSVTLNFENLEALCQDCHNKEHHGSYGATRYDVMFDEDGDVISSTPPYHRGQGSILSTDEWTLD